MKNKNSWMTRLVKTGHSRFQIGKGARGTCKMGYFVPVYIRDLVPGDHLRLSVRDLVRFMPMQTPPMHNVKVYFDWFFVPNRLVWKNWEDFRTGGKDGKNSSVHPYMVSPAGGYKESTLADYLGIPVNVAGLKHDALPFRACQLIYNYYVRDENFEDEHEIAMTDGEDTTTSRDLYRRCWPRDYFTSCLDAPQRGDDTYLPLGTEAPVVGTGKALGLTDGTVSGGLSSAVSAPALFNFYTGNLGSVVGTANSGQYNSGGVSIGVVSDSENSGLKADLTSSTAISVDQLHLAVQTQRIKQLLMRAGYRYREFMLAFFGTDGGDARLQWPEYIGGSCSDILFSEVLQTSSTNDTSPQGNLAGHGISASSSRPLTYHAKEDGWLFCFMSVMPKASYQQGLNRMWSRFTRYDYYNPVLANIGEQLVLNKEIYAQGTADDDLGFGYQPVYEDYRRAYDSSHGAIHSSMANWTFDRVFAELPLLNQEFLECVPSTAPFAVIDQSVDNVIYGVQTDVRASRPMPRFPNPGYIGGI